MTQEVEDKRNRDTGALDNWFPGENTRIDNDAVSIVCGFSVHIVII
jgi:hypothetical protein